ncbi:MAG: pantoate--beta-alanine ligase [Candidatus Omnitrophota bacterium]
MRVISSLKKINKLLMELRAQGKSIGFVPTMGALHSGHLSLIKQAQKENDFLVVSIFVNPAQFGPQEDLSKYPRPLKNDLLLCRKAKVDLVFLPDKKNMYPHGFATFVRVEKIGDILCGAARPGHFRGVATVVAKLLNIVVPHVIYFGQKDAQQVAIIKKMISDLNFFVKIKVMPTVREKSGLAMSSRNLYLSKEDAALAGVLREALNKAKALIRGGSSDYQGIILRMKKMIREKGPFGIDYISIVDLHNLNPVNKTSKGILVALAVRIDKVRLIDNVVVRKNNRLIDSVKSSMTD